MYRYLLGAIMVLFSSVSVLAQADIEIHIKNYESDTMILGYYLADKMLVKDSIIRKEGESTFRYTQDTLMDPGMYMVVSVPEGMFYQVLVGEDQEEQNFKVIIDTLTEQEIFFDGSQENYIFYEYLNYITASRKEVARLDDVLSRTDTVLRTVRDQLEEDKVMLDIMVKQKQNKLLEEHPESIAAILVSSNLPFNFPEFTGTPEEIQDKRYRHYKSRYFDNINLDHPAVLRTPVIHQRIDYYLDNLTLIEADSVISSVDTVLAKMEGNPELYRYYLSYFLNKYGNSKYIGLDAVYVHLALNYYGKDKAPWITEENKQEIISNAKKIEPILIGKPAPDFTIYEEDGTPITLSELDDRYTVLIFWKPNCGHCTKAMPHVIDFDKKWKEKGVKTITICTKNGKDFKSCWEDVRKKNMQSLINGADQYGKSRILSKYYATSTPKIFIIDKDKNIKLKKIPAENLDAVMEQMYLEDEKRAMSQGEE